MTVTVTRTEGRGPGICLYHVPTASLMDLFSGLSPAHWFLLWLPSSCLLASTSLPPSLSLCSGLALIPGVAIPKALKPRLWEGCCLWPRPHLPLCTQASGCSPGPTSGLSAQFSRL